MIIRGGENISPVEIEECIRMFPCRCGMLKWSVSHVQFAGRNSGVHCFEKNCELTKEEITAHCSKYLAAYKVPRYIEFLKNFR